MRELDFYEALTHITTETAGSLRSPAAKHRGAAPPPFTTDDTLYISGNKGKDRTDSGGHTPIPLTALGEGIPCLTAGERSEPAEKGTHFRPSPKGANSNSYAGIGLLRSPVTDCATPRGERKAQKAISVSSTLPAWGTKLFIFTLNCPCRDAPFTFFSTTAVVYPPLSRQADVDGR